jgi:DNA-binding transcriptional LysR family regulator
VNLAPHLDKLKAFKAIAESRTIGDAAKRLHITQPSLTKLIQTLEAATGAKLLIRGRHGIAVTGAGQQLLLYATQTLNALSDLEQRLLNPADNVAGHLRIGAYASLGEYLWPEFLSAFRKKYPQLQLSILSAEGSSHQRALEREEIDILIDAEPRASGDVSSWNLYEDRFNFYVGKQTETKFSPDTVDGLTLILSPSAFDSENKKILQHLEERGYFFKERLEFDSFTAVLAFARKGVGLAVLPNRLAQEVTKAGILRQAMLKGFAHSGFGTHLFAATILDSRKDDPRIKILIHSLKDWFGFQKSVKNNIRDF